MLKRVHEADEHVHAPLHGVYYIKCMTRNAYDDRDADIRAYAQYVL